MPKIVVVTPNPAIDLTYLVPRPRLGQVHRVKEVVRRAGGKGLNVASVLAQLGARATVTGFLGGSAGEQLRGLLASWQVDQDWVGLGEQVSTRSAVAVSADDGTVTVFNEPGPTVPASSWQDLGARVRDRLQAGDVLVVSGSCPPGTRTEDLEDLLVGAREQGARVVLDTSGPLLGACAGLAEVVKPNREELLEVTGATDLLAGAKALLAQGAATVVVSDGPRGMHLLSQAGQVRGWHAPAPKVDVVNPTGAGDAAVAALAHQMAHSPGPVGERALVEAVALSVAAVVTPVAGVVDLGTYQRVRPQVVPEPEPLPGI